MLTTATNFLARHVFVVMPKTSRKTTPAWTQFTYPLPYGAVLRDGGVQFVVFSRSATAMRVLLYDSVNDPDPSRIIEFKPKLRPLGRHLERVRSRVSRPASSTTSRPTGRSIPKEGQRFIPDARLIDPYARALAGRFLPNDDGIIRPPKCVVVDDSFDWKGDRHLKRPLSETIIYEMHVRGFTQSAHQQCEAPRHVPRRHRKDSVFEIARRDGGRADAGPRVPDRRNRRLEARRARTTGATTRWPSSRRTAATWKAPSPATRCGSSRKWSASCTPPASK